MFFFVPCNVLHFTLLLYMFSALIINPIFCFISKMRHFAGKGTLKYVLKPKIKTRHVNATNLSIVYILCDCGFECFMLNFCMSIIIRGWLWPLNYSTKLLFYTIFDTSAYGDWEIIFCHSFIKMKIWMGLWNFNTKVWDSPIMHSKY